MKFIKLCLIMVVSLIAALPVSVYAQKSNIKVMVLPFDMRGGQNLTAFRRNVMDSFAAALSSAGAEITAMDAIKDLVLKEGVKDFDENTAFDIAARTDADFAVLGSINAIGSSRDVNWRVIDLRSKNAVAFYYRAADTDGEVIKKLGEAGRETYAKMFAVLNARPAARTGTIGRIAITGNRRVDTDAILRKIIARIDEPYSPDDVKDDIRAIYATGFFDDVSAELTDTVSGKVLTYSVKEMPFIKKISFRGNKELKDEKLKESVTLKENTVLDRVILGENTEKIKNVYSEDGYYLATVKPVIESDGAEATVVFEINEGPEVKVKRITTIGNKFFSASDIKGFMATKEAGIFSFLTSSGKFSEMTFQNDLAIIMNNYMENGYIQADVIDYRVLLSEDKKWFYVTIAFTEGTQFRVGKLDVKGDILDTREDLFKKMKLKTGEVFNRTRLSQTVEALSDTYGDKGYAYVDIKPQTQIDPEKKIVDVTFEIKKNELVYLERIDITGNVRTRDKVIRREIELGEGDLYSSSAMKRSKSNLKRLGYFDDVKINQGRGTANDKMKLDVGVKEVPTGAVSVGFGYSSVDHLVGTASVSQSNFMGKGIKLEVSGTVSTSGSNKYMLSVTEPWLFDKPLSAGFDLYHMDKTYSDFSLSKKGFDVRFGFPLTDRYTRGYVTYKLENVNITNVSSTASTYILDQAGESLESSIKFSAKRDTRDDAFFPTDGMVINASTEFAGGPLGGTSYFLKYEGDAIRYFGLPWECTYSIHGAAGYVQGYDGHSPPIYEKYFLGGINSIRGFETRSISPKDPSTGDLIGGNVMFTINNEVVFPIAPKQNLRGVVFYDLGNSYDKNINLSDIRQGAGLGLRWFSPIGPLRLELGFNLDRREGEKPQQWDFTIGTMF